CIRACPGKVPRIVKNKNAVIICDLCDGEPECVKICERAGYYALKTIHRPTTSIIMHYAKTPEEITKPLVRKVLGMEPNEVM
ncbi:MAG: 4Fe-4S dicluster domain-containing protein, partial [Staphylothermus sp.]|nr:4Fe-4S dicluster domain-containing protein [Staphylothermus sp.]